MAENLVGNLLRNAGSVSGRERSLLPVDDNLQGLSYSLVEIDLPKIRVVQLRAERV